ncbi:hypothetical protein [Pantoea agglomerans]|uniref:hypothetical protein n=1 Tax=Enterobacter agglomerans TaxID=549 RepID=UPI002413301F|nr:hypothetical protein [Pantoea agglomerans]
MPNKYEKLDDLVLHAITNVPKRFGEIFIGTLASECRRLAGMEAGKEPFLVMDRRLQALRKVGKIKSTPKGWVSQETAK